MSYIENGNDSCDFGCNIGSFCDQCGCSQQEQIGEQLRLLLRPKSYPFRFRVKAETTCSSKKFVRLLLCMKTAMIAIPSPSPNQSRETSLLKVDTKVPCQGCKVRPQPPQPYLSRKKKKKKNPYCFHLCSHSFDVFLQFFHVFCKSIPQLVELESNEI